MVRHGDPDAIQRAAALIRRIRNDFGLSNDPLPEVAETLAREIVAGDVTGRECAVARLINELGLTRIVARAVFIRLFRRVPSDGDLSVWAGEISSVGATGLLVAWLSSEEYFLQRAHGSNALYASVLPRDLMIDGFVDLSGELETMLTQGADRSEVASFVVQLAMQRGWFSRNIALRLGLKFVDTEVEPVSGEGDRLLLLLTGYLASPEYIEGASEFPSARVQSAARVARVLSGDSEPGPLVSDISEDLAITQGPHRAMARHARCDHCVMQHLRSIVFPALRAFDLTDAQIEQLVLSLNDSRVQAFAGKPFAVELARILQEFAGPEFGHAADCLGYGAGLVEDWERRLDAFSTRIVAGWFTHALSFNAPAERIAFWVRRLVANEYYCAVYGEFLASADFWGADPVVFYDGEISLSQPPGSLTYFETAASAGPNCVRERMRLATTYFYWYDVHHHRSLMSSPDDLNDSERLSLTLRPPSIVDFSYLSFDWNRKEVADLIEAGIDIALPVYYGAPFCDSIQSCNTHDHSRNYRSDHADPGLRMLRRAILATRSGLKLGMFYDTTSLNSVNAKHLHIDFQYRVSFDWFYESIRNFFSHLPRDLWALRDGSPIIFVYHPCFGLNLRSTLYPFVRKRFRSDFGVEPYIVTAAEEEAPRVLQNHFVSSRATNLTFENWRERLAELLAEDHLFASCLSDTRVYAAHLVGALFGQADGQPAFQPSAVFAAASGVLSESNSARAEQREYYDSTIGALSQRFNEVQRKTAILELLQGETFIEWQTKDWLHRFLRVRSQEWTDRHHEIAMEVADMLRQGQPYAACLLAIFSSDEFKAAAGGESRIIDLVYQTLVWRCPNPDYVNNHSTIDTIGQLEFESLRRQHGLETALTWFLDRFEVAEAVVSDWLFKFYGWYNPGPADSSFYWGGAIAPVVRDVVSIGPGYDQSALLTRPRLVQPRHGGKRYQDMLTWIAEMNPQPWLLHIETWNEFFEGSCICNCAEFGRQYIQITSQFADRLRSGHFTGPSLSEPSRRSSGAAYSRAAKMSKLETVFDGCHWHQRWEVEPGVFTPGQNDVARIMHSALVPQSLSGKRILDIGAWNGCFSFECERRGAAEVLAIGPEPAADTGFDKLKDYLGSKVEYRQGTIYHLQPEEIGLFDIVLCFGVLYHLRHPLLGMDMIRRIARGDLHIETYADPSEGPAAWQFFRLDELNRDPSNWFAPNRAALEAMLHSSGFEPVHVGPCANNRISAYARVVAGNPEWMKIGSGEGVYYDVITKPILGPSTVYGQD